MSQSRELLDLILENIVEYPEDVHVDEMEEPDGTIVFEVRVHEDDMGKVIGRSGRVAQAIRTLVRAASAPDERISVDIID